MLGLNSQAWAEQTPCEVGYPGAHPRTNEFVNFGSWGKPGSCKVPLSHPIAEMGAVACKARANTQFFARMHVYIT